MAPCTPSVADVEREKDKDMAKHETIGCKKDKISFLVFLATLATLPADVYEAARLDRANAWQRFRYLTLPLIRPAIIMVVIMRTMTALSAFDAIFAATGGGPGSSTEILNLYAYRTSFTELNLGYGSSLAMVLLGLTLAVSYVMFKRRKAAK